MKADNSTMTIQELEYAIVAKNFAEAERILIYLTTVYTEDKVELTAAPFNRALTKEQKVLESYQVIEKLATLITTWFSDWSYTPSKETYAFICLQKSFINNLFTASSYHSTDHILTNLALINKTDYTPEQLRRLLFVITVETAIDVPWAQLFKHIPDLTVLSFSGQIRSISIQMSNRCQRNIGQLIEGAKHAPIVHTKDPENLSPLIATFFNCSNLAHPEKYEIKKWIVRCFESFMQEYLTPGLKKRIKNDVKARPDTNKPTILVFHEFYHYNHAMYRGHHPRIAVLREKFHVVGMGIDSQFDSLGQEDFDDVIVIPEAEKLDLNSMVKKILKVKPDVVFYPSVGMTIYVPLIATLRLAPIQIASAGHPASTFIPNIDYFHCLDIGISEKVMESIISEKWMPGKRKGLFRKETPINLTPTHINKEIVNIVVNGVIQKISHEVIAACTKITENSNKSVKFHFFMAHPKQDIEFFSASSLLRRFLPNSEIHPFLSYNRYMSVLNDCDFAIATFPFGGTNSNVDLVRLNKPKLFILDKSDVCGLTDMDIWGSLDYLSGLCSSVDTLVDKATSWVNDEAMLKDEILNMKGACLNEKFNTAEQSSLSTELSDGIYQYILEANND